MDNCLWLIKMAPGKPKSSTPASPALELAIKGFDELTHETEDPVVALIKLMQAKRLNAADLKSEKESKLNSFSTAEYSALAPLFGLSPSEGYEEFDKMTIPRVALPRDVQLDLFDAGRESILAFGHPSRHDNEHVRDNFLTPVCLYYQLYQIGRTTDGYHSGLQS